MFPPDVAFLRLYAITKFSLMVQFGFQTKQKNFSFIVKELTFIVAIMCIFLNIQTYLLS